MADNSAPFCPVWAAPRSRASWHPGAGGTAVRVRERRLRLAGIFWYHVFILSRIREALDRGVGSEEAVAHGIKSSAGVVTSAAIVMVGVFAIFGTLSMLMFKQFGVGLATAVLIDATIVRAVLLPASMKLLGDWNWYLPRWLQWLPRLERRESGAVPEVKPAPSSA